VYAQRTLKPTREHDLALLGLIDEQYTRRPFYGSRKRVSFLKTRGYWVNRKRVQRLMRILGLAGMAPGPHTSRPHPQHKVYPYLLRGVVVTRPNQVLRPDITYVRLAHGFVYPVAVIDWYSRRVLSWRISNTLDTAFCVDCLEEALQRYGNPEIFNTDQGCQFTGENFTGVLKAHGIAISMDGRGRALDNIFVERLWRSVKYEDVYLKGYNSAMELMIGLAEYFVFYNGERPRPSCQATAARTALLAPASPFGWPSHAVVDLTFTQALAAPRRTRRFCGNIQIQDATPCCRHSQLYFFFFGWLISSDTISSKLPGE